MSQLVDIEPPDELLAWVAKHGTRHVDNPLDRGWLYVGPITSGTPISVWPFECRCGTLGGCKRLKTHDGSHYLYLGQCVVCETIAWAYRRRTKELEP